MQDTDGQQTHVLLVDDSPETLDLVRHSLRQADFLVRTALSGEEALASLAADGLPHLAIVDMNMPPGMSGAEFCRRLLRFSDVPIIMLTAVDEGKTIVEAIQQYAEDYVIKPFNPAELVARARRVLDTIGRFPFPAETPIPVDERMEVDFVARNVFLGGQPTSLTPTESRLLYLLMAKVGKTANADFLLRRMWPLERVDEDRLHVYVHRLRKKLDGEEQEHEYIVSVRGVGYRFQPHGEQGA